MKKLIRCANQYIWESDWKTIGLLKFCLLSLGICVGMAVPEEKKKTVRTKGISALLPVLSRRMAPRQKARARTTSPACM